MELWMIGLAFATVLCFVRAVLDLRGQRYAWALLGFAAGAALLCIPLPPVSVTVDLPVNG
jgi:hypothetical protein